MMSKLKTPKKAITRAEVLKLVTVVKRRGKWCIKDVKSDVCGDVEGWIGGNVWGNVGGDVVGYVVGDVNNVGGDVCCAVYGDVGGSVYGNVGGAVYGNVKKCVRGTVGPKPKRVTKKKTGGKLNGQKSRKATRRQKNAR